jgi:amino acid adenylation domain-containing protein
MESIVGYRLSPRQRHLWALLQDGAPRDARALLRLRGALDEDALRAAVDALAARHEVLRTAFERLPGMPEALQVPGETGVRWEDGEDLSALPAAVRDARIEALWAGEPVESVDGESVDGELPAARLVRAGADEHLLLLRVHPLSVDAASWEHLARDLAALYAAERGGAPVEDEPVPYLAVSEWVNDEAASEEAQEGRAYWAKQLEGTENALGLERDAGEPGMGPASARRTLPAALAASVDALASAAGASRDAVLLAGWKALLHRLGGAGEVRVGVAADGRTDDELRHAVGPFAEPLPLTTAMEPETGFRALVERLRDALEYAANWQVALDREAVRQLAGREDEPLRAGFTVVPAAETHAAGGVAITVERSRVVEDAFALHLRVVPAEGGIGLVLEGGATVPAEQPALLLDRYETLLADALARPDAPVRDLEMLSAAERARIVDDFNGVEGGSVAADSADPLSAAEPVHARIEAQAARTPDAPAVRFGGETVSYGELNARANRRARHLRTLGVGPETRVGIMLPSSPARVEATLAVLKAGGAYVPLDPAYPQDRLAFMIRDAGLPLVLTSAALREKVPAADGVSVVAAEDVADAVAAQSAENLHLPIHHASAAYVIYTSGSTGTPKGVLVEHGALAAHAAAVQAHYGLNGTDRILQFASFNFDASVEQTLPPLAAGACVVLREEAVSSVETLGRYVADGLTILNLPTAQWHLLAEAWARGESVPDLRALRLMIAGGEAMLPRYAARWFATPAAGARLLNAYGPTEAVVTATTYDVPAAAGAAPRVPIGRPFGGRTAYVLDAALQPAPIGVPGELCLGGVLARGYLGRPALTAERFVPDAHGRTPGARLYRTGDGARWGECVSAEVRECGSGSDSHDVSRPEHKATDALTHSRTHALVFLGRADDQVKVRGFRIELGEVEAALDRHPDVRQSAVVVEDRGEGDHQLTAYWVRAGEALPDPAALRAHLLRHLPEYMVPGVFIALEAMPLTTVGKTDRRALPAQRRVAAERPYVAPSTPTEEQVAAIWGEVMRQERVSMDETFFGAGGHSLLATQLTSRLRKHFNVDLQIGRVFDAESVAHLARTVDELAASAGDPGDAGETIGRASREGRRVRGAELAALLDS